jgi:hypothetical protein
LASYSILINSSRIYNLDERYHATSFSNFSRISRIFWRHGDGTYAEHG